MNIYRFSLNNNGIFAELDSQVPKDSPLREGKPDGSWLPKVGKDYPGAISFFTPKGLLRYNQSGLKNWHYLVTEGAAQMLITEKPEKVLYEDEFQVIVDSKTEIKKSYPFVYEGPSKAPIPPEDNRPEFIRHHSSLQDYFAYAFYSGSDESFTQGAALGSDLGLKNLGIHYEILAPHKRSSWPHAHSSEEEFVYFLEGEAHLWINGKEIPAKAGDIVYFPPGSNLAHTVMNKTDSPVKMIVIGETNAPNDLIYYPEHEKRNKECEEGGYFWKDRPEAPLFNTHKNISEFEQKDSGGIDEPLHYFFKGRDLGRALGAKRIALHHQEIMPGFRSGIPHCESLEEEFIFVLKGSLIAWINGRRYPMSEGDSCALPAGTGILHTFINDSDSPVEILMIGETWKDDNQCIYGINPELQEPDKPLHWHDWPEQDLGDESSLPKKIK